MKRKIIIIVVCLVLFWACTLWYSMIKNNKNDVRGYSRSIDLLASIDDRIRSNSVRCGPFQLAWNDMVGEIEFGSKSQAFDNLNMQTFTNEEVSKDVYYNKYWLFTFDLKSEIEDWVKDKFQENIDISNFLPQSSIIPQSSDYYDWKKEKKYGIFTKFRKIINLKNEFEKLEEWKFADLYDDVKYFGISCNSDKKYNQVRVLYYESDADFAVSIKTQWWDDIILSRWTKWSSFMGIYNEIISRWNAYRDGHEFTKHDCLKIPEFRVRFMYELDNLKYQKFTDTDGQIYRIEAAIQDVEVRLDKTASKKTEEHIGEAAIQDIMWIKHRYFYFDEPFTVFVKESDKKLPYFAAQISNIQLF